MHIESLILCQKEKSHDGAAFSFVFLFPFHNLRHQFQAEHVFEQFFTASRELGLFYLVFLRLRMKTCAGQQRAEE